VQFQVIGKSSGKIFEIEATQEELVLTMLDYLRGQGFAVASSCRGEAVCRKCIINSEILSCEYTVLEFYKKFGKKITIDYL